MPVVDFHNHYYPPEYLDALGPSGSTLRITTDGEGNPSSTIRATTTSSCAAIATSPTGERCSTSTGSTRR